MAINNNIIGEANQPSPHGGEMVRGFKNVFVKPDEQSQACLSFAMARKRAMKWNVFVKPDEQNRACSSYAMARKRRMKSNIIFDLGRILVGLDNERCIAAFERVGLEKIAFYVREHRVEDLFLAAEVGDITTPQFCDEVRRLCQCSVPDTDIIWAWNELLTGIPDAKKEALLALRRSGHRLFLLSNTNFMHWDKCAADFFPYRDSEGHTYTATHFFEKIFLSCAMHLAKPDPAIFTEALRQAGIKAEDTLFIDDREDNCQAAQSVGITALHDPEGEIWYK